jgi:hypothetical protein
MVKFSMGKTAKLSALVPTKGSSTAAGASNKNNEEKGE